ncbi:MAG: hypothetical protein U5L45_20255 [Saprospiraceae bacterium]|nr:hypothetical protein [Saprospiraceae bacterium]
MANADFDGTELIGLASLAKEGVLFVFGLCPKTNNTPSLRAKRTIDLLKRFSNCQVKTT